MKKVSLNGNNMTLQEKILSIRETVGVSYSKPPKEKLDKFRDELKNSQVAQDYLEKHRGLSKDTVDHFKLGYDSERNAIAIPVFKRDELVNIKYRFIDPNESRYSSEKNAESWMFNDNGVDKAKERGAVLICEGQFDLMSIWQVGITNVISSSSGKDAYGSWIELLDNIPKIYIALDNDKGGRESARKIAERLGVEKCMEVVYPEGIKDANEYFKKHTKDEFKELLRKARPFYTYQFKGVGDVINSLRDKKDDTISVELLPLVKIEKDWLLILSGKSNAGKTSIALNMANELVNKDIPTLILPFERGIETVGKRFLQVRFDKTIQQFLDLSSSEWDNITNDCLDLPLYFAMPKKDDVVATILKSKRIFGTKVVIVDHLDYLVRHTSGSKEAEIGNTLQELKRIAEEHGIIMLIVTHIRKIEQAGSMCKRKPGIEDLKGSSSLYQDPECVAMITAEQEGTIKVDIVKNKGEMTSKEYNFNVATGKASSGLIPVGTIATKSDVATTGWGDFS